MRNIILFLLHFSIISHLKSINSINTQISHKKFKNSKCFISNYNLYNSTLINDKPSNNTHKKQIKGLDSESTVKETDKNTEILVESPSSPLKSIIDKGSIKSSSIRHEILDKESILDELIVSNDNFKDVVEDLDEITSDSDKNIDYSTKKLEDVLKVLESSVLKKTVDKKEQVIKPSDKILKRRSKETIYTRLQNYVKSSEPILSKHNLLEEVKNFVHLLHWNVWHTNSLDISRGCSWTSNQFQRFRNLMDRIDQIINEELGNYIDITTNTDQDLIGGVIEEKTNFIYSNNYMYNKLREIIEFVEFDLYRNRMVYLLQIKRKLVSIFKKLTSFIVDPRETVLYKRTRARLSIFKNHLKHFKYKIYSKLNKTRIFMNKFEIPSVVNKNKKQNRIDDRPSVFVDPRYDKVTLADFLRFFSHTHIVPQHLKDLDNIVREDLYKDSKKGDWSLYFVGSGSRQPTNTRLTSTMAFKRNGRYGPIWLFDCGEGTKNGLERLGLDPCQVERIFLTHLHGDHCYGIFSFLYLRERTKNLKIYGPPGTRKLIEAIHKNTSTSTYNLYTIQELIPKTKKDVTGNTGTGSGSSSFTNIFGSAERQGVGSSGLGGVEEAEDIYINSEGYYNVLKTKDIEILAADLEHTMPTVGYVIQQRDSRNAKKNQINKKIVICQDSSDSSKMKKISMNADVLIHEATLSPTSSLVSGILLNIIRDNKELALSYGSIRKLYNFLSNVETKLGCFNFTLSALSSFVKCERYYLLQKLNIFKNFINTFKPLDKELNEEQNNNNTKKNKKEIEKKLKEKWLNNIFTFMDRLNAINELNKNEYFIKRLQNRYQLMKKLSKVIPTLDMNKVINTASKKVMFSKILENHGTVNDAYERYDISNKYRDKFIVDVPEYLNSVSRDIFEYWNEILQLELSSKSNADFEESIDLNWKLLYDRIIGSFGHSTPNMAGNFASDIKAKKLILTHFSNKYPGDEKLENLLTMIRIENEARMGFAKNSGTKIIPVIAAWDKMKLEL